MFPDNLNDIPRKLLMPAVFNVERTHRYLLRRWWGEGRRFVQFVGLNPSKADEFRNDRTVRRCIRFARDWGYDGMFMTNAFSIIATDPADMIAAGLKANDRTNDAMLSIVAHYADMIVVCWSAMASHLSREEELMNIFEGQALWCFGLTKDGHPRHPLYMRAAVKPSVFVPANSLLAAAMRGGR